MFNNLFINTRSGKFIGPVIQAVMAVVGLAVSGLTYIMLPLVTENIDRLESLRVLGLIAAGCLGGFLLRVARRYVFFIHKGTLHQMLSFESVFQGAIAFNPQLEYPGVESAFISRFGRISHEAVANWFKVRSTSAIAIPMVLIGIVIALSDHLQASLICFIVCLSWIVVKTRGINSSIGRICFFSAEILGILAAVVEGTAFAYACMLICHDGLVQHYLLLYLVILSAYEFSPVPFGLGMLELTYVGMDLLRFTEMPGLAVILVYRACRLLVLLLTALYLPRYKLNLKDIYNPELSLILKKYNRPEGGWADVEYSQSAVKLSIVIPAYNEAERLPVYLPQVVDYCEGKDFGTQILVVDDGSIDSTAEYVEKVSSQHPIVKLLKQPQNMGKGAAVKRGALEAEGLYVLFADADGATPIREADSLLATVETGIEVAIASRTAQGGQAQRSLLRSLVGAAFYRLTNLLAVPTVSDTQCGFKMFRNFAARKIFSQVQETGWAFDVEVLFLAQKYDYAIREVPVEWNAVPGSKVNLIRDSLSMLWALWRIRRRSAGMTDME